MHPPNPFELKALRDVLTRVSYSLNIDNIVNNSGEEKTLGKFCDTKLWEWDCSFHFIPLSKYDIAMLTYKQKVKIHLG